MDAFVLSGLGPVDIALELSNLPVMLMWLFLAMYLARANNVVASILFLHFGLVFLTSQEFILSKFSDQTHYSMAAMYYRTGVTSELYFDIKHLPGLLFAIFPIPSIRSVESASMVNVMYYVLLYVFLVKKKILIGRAQWFYLLYPSLMFYSSMALRDGIVMICMVLGVYFFQKKRYILAGLAHFPLAALKFQNFLIFAVAVMFFMITSPRLNIFYRVLMVGFVFFAASHFADLMTIDEINRYRRWMYFENHNESLEGYIPIESYQDIVVIGLLSAPYMIMKPFPWEAANAFQFFQSIENIFIDIFIIFSVYHSIKNKHIRGNMWFLNLYFFTGMCIYGLVTDNFGTAARYRYPFVTFYLVYFFYYFEMYKIKIRMDRMRAYWEWCMSCWQQQVRPLASREVV
ncbi:MAG: hypothetical protein HQL63_08510 [Magnetococcales bacterium]|nr:hypothetical protein [Magnetococcales bacterium]